MNINKVEPGRTELDVYFAWSKVRQFQVPEPQSLRPTILFNADRFHCFVSPLMVFLERCHEVAHIPLSRFGQRVKGRPTRFAVLTLTSGHSLIPRRAILHRVS